MKHWYALHCKPQQDARAEHNLLNQHFEVFRPLIRLRRRRRGKPVDVVESMFPRYLFLCLDNLSENWAPIRSTFGVAGLVRWGNQVPIVPRPVIRQLRDRLGEDGCVDLTCAEGFRKDEHVRITEGPFAGLEAVYQARHGDERVVVLLSIMQQLQRLSLPEAHVSKA